MGELNFGRILRRAAQFGDAPALRDLATGHRSSYREHLDRIGRLCSVMTELSLDGASPFAVLAGTSHHYVELWRAGLAGAGLINPLNARLVEDELVYILNDSEARVLFVDAENAERALMLRDRVPSLERIVQIGAGAECGCDGVLEEMMHGAKPALPPEPEDDAPAVLMYTGGTTGLPKGVLLDQRAVVLVVYRMLIDFPIEPGARFLNFMPMFHIGSITSWGLLLPSGGQTIVMPAFEPRAVNAAIRDHEVTLIGAVPTMLAMMLDRPDFEPEQLASLRLVLYGAAPMPPSLIDRLQALSPNLSLAQSYGMTECASTVTILRPSDHRRGGERLASVGRSAVGVEIEIRDADGCAVPVGEVGEIHIRCDSVMREYWGKPEQTHASLVDGWYRSGDAGRLDKAGYLFLADRVKDMIVTGGENVYSIEVEHAIESHPAVSQVAVVGLPDDTWGETVHAVVVCAPEATNADELENHARKKIAGFKIPRSWTFQTEPLPLSAAGKVLKRTLRRIHVNAESSEADR